MKFNTAYAALVTIMTVANHLEVMASSSPDSALDGIDSPETRKTRKLKQAKSKTSTPSCPELQCPELQCPELQCPELQCPELQCPEFPCPELPCSELLCPDQSPTDEYDVPVSLLSQLNLLALPYGSTGNEGWYQIQSRANTDGYGSNQVVQAMCNLQDGVQVMCTLPSSSNTMQSWHYTGDGTLRVKGLGENGFLTQSSRWGISFKARDHDDLGQTWDLSPTGELSNVKYSTMCLNLYGGRGNLNARTISVFEGCTGDGSINERWLKYDGNPIPKLEAIGIQYLPFILDAEEAGAPIPSATVEGSGKIEVQIKRSQTKTTSHDYHANISFGLQFQTTLTASGTVLFATATAEVQQQLSINVGFAFGVTNTDSTSEEIVTSFTHDVPEGQIMRYTYVGRRYTGRLPYTMTFDDGSTLNGFVDHSQTFAIFESSIRVS